jgi:hypothetical protein
MKWKLFPSRVTPPEFCRVLPIDYSIQNSHLLKVLLFFTVSETKTQYYIFYSPWQCMTQKQKLTFSTKTISICTRKIPIFRFLLLKTEIQYQPIFVILCTVQKHKLVVPKKLWKCTVEKIRLMTNGLSCDCGSITPHINIVFYYRRMCDEEEAEIKLANKREAFVWLFNLLYSIWNSI